MTDELNFCIQHLNSTNAWGCSEIVVSTDDMNSIYFTCCLNNLLLQQDDTSDAASHLLLRIIATIDSILAYGTVFFDFYISSIAFSKSSRDPSKHLLLQAEITHYVEAYKFRFHALQKMLLQSP